MSPAAMYETTRESVEKATDEVLTKARKASDEARELFKKSDLFKTWLNFNRQLGLAGIGAIVLLSEQVQSVADRCIARGEDIEKDAADYTRRQFDAVKAWMPGRKAGAEEVAEAAEATAEEVVEAAEEVVAEAA